MVTYRGAQGHVLLMAIVVFLVNLLQLVFGSILDTVAASLNVSVALAGQLNTAYAAGFAVGTPLILLVTRRFRSKPIFLAAEAALMVGTLATALTPDLTALLVIRTFVGVAAGVCSAVGTALVAQIVKPDHRAKALFNLALGASAAFILGMPLSRYLVTFADWTVIFLVIAALFAVVLLLGAATLPSPRAETADTIPLRTLFRRPVLWLAFGTCFVMFVGYSMVFAYLAPLLAFVSVRVADSIAWILMALGLASFAGTKLGAWMVGRLGPVKTMRWGIAAQACFLAVPALFPQSEPLVIAALVLWIVSAWAVGPTFNLVLIAEAPEAAGLLLSLNTSVIQLGFAGGAAAGGLALSLWSERSLAWCATAATGLSILSALRLRQQATRREE